MGSSIKKRWPPPPGQATTAPQCGAKTRQGGRCGAPGLRNGRCKAHGGLSTGPRTPEGLLRSKTARLQHGRYSKAAKLEARRLREFLRACNANLTRIANSKHTQARKCE
jgi:hypothetical protein